ncbi:glycosyltransferase family 2 protein [Euhalothece natronophila Z-M001]|uniref:Glycosyltransferase family 2 protein n=1 Tax=Euhalothece natronophila Z-M001 TaxID=522448 RepID=A0A5B8NIS3_9CHRO|nr:glycosyltransferase family 2 protein [Euhalothece natronophila]QDZ39112.1 glycosyltransferase family 2 protein [Euhalothece natronophila Z-M001]
MPHPTSVAICIPTYNQAKYLPESVISACQQTYPHVEVWVSDDASTDETPTVMSQLRQKFPQIRYYRQPKNLGIAANNTWLLSQPNTPYIVRLDSDDILKPNYLEILVPLMEKYADAGYAHAAVEQIDEYGKKHGIRRLARNEEFWNGEKELKAAVSGFRMAANLCLFRAAALHELNVYQDRPEFVEDYDLIVRMADVGYGNIYSDQILGSYRVWTDTKAVRPKRKALELRGLIRIYEESLLPAFARRNWNPKPIQQQRCRLALIHAPYCFRPLFTSAERKELVDLLKALGDSPALRLRLVALHCGFRPFLEWRYSAEIKLKRTIKDCLISLKTLRTNPLN